MIHGFLAAASITIAMLCLGFPGGGIKPVAPMVFVIFYGLSLLGWMFMGISMASYGLMGISLLQLTGLFLFVFQTRSHADET